MPPRCARSSTLRTTLDGGLQAEIESLVRGRSARFAGHRASAAAVLVLDNDSAAVRANVGSPDHRAEAGIGTRVHRHVHVDAEQVARG